MRTRREAEQRLRGRERNQIFEGRIIVAVALGAGLGGVVRLLVTQFVIARLGLGSAFYATLFINVSGSFLIGLVLETAQVRGGLNPLWRYFLATGILGGYTTFSTFSFEAYALFTGALGFSGLLYVVASVTLGIFGALLGITAGKTFAR